MIAPCKKTKCVVLNADTFEKPTSEWGDRTMEASKETINSKIVFGKELWVVDYVWTMSYELKRHESLLGQSFNYSCKFSRLSLQPH